MATERQRIVLKTQWRRSRITVLVYEGLDRQDAIRQSYRQVCRLTTQDLLDWDAMRRSEAKGA